MTILGLQSNPDVWQVQVQISTEELAGELSLVEDHTTYLIHVLGGAFDKDGKIISVASEVEGETVELLQMISAIWVDADKKDGLKKVWTWDAIVTLMRDVTKASYDVKGERTLRC
jgi:hypothetical protein